LKVISEWVGSIFQSDMVVFLFLGDKYDVQ